jgi:hypothetical protein
VTFGICVSLSNGRKQVHTASLGRRVTGKEGNHSRTRVLVKFIGLWNKMARVPRLNSTIMLNPRRQSCELVVVSGARVHRDVAPPLSSEEARNVV